MLDEEFRKRIRVPEPTPPDFLEQELFNKEKNKSVKYKKEHTYYGGAFELEDMLMKQEDDGIIK